MNINIFDIIKNNGATLDKQGNNRIYKKGYQVSTCDLAIIDLANIDKITEFINKARISKKEFLGLWVDDGKMYIDKSKHYNSKQEAIKQGLALNQISIYDWHNKNCIYLLQYRKKGVR